MAIVGSGPAGLSAAINCIARNRSVTVLGRKIETSMLYKAELVNNHLGMPNMTGKEILTSFLEHSKRMNVEIKEGRVSQILPSGQGFMLSFENEIIEARSVILSIGISKPGEITGESKYLGKGLSYCATCDGMLYKNKNVVVYSEIEEGTFELDFLSNICKSVTYISHEPPNINRENVTIINGKPSEILGDEFVSGIRVEGDVIPCDGLFFVKKSVPINTLINGLHIEDNAIIVSRLMETNIAGIFACGDCTGYPYQLSNAIGEGLVAAQQCDRFLFNNVKLD